jgi:hypothetical protein
MQRDDRDRTREKKDGRHLGMCLSVVLLQLHAFSSAIWEGVFERTQPYMFSALSCLLSFPDLIAPVHAIIIIISVGGGGVTRMCLFETSVVHHLLQSPAPRPT